MSVRVRPVRADDLEALREIEREGFEDYHEFAPPGWEPPDVSIPPGLLAEPRVIWLVADVDGVPAGHTLIVPASLSREPVDDDALGHLMALFVGRRAWGSGVAAALTDAALERARREGFERVRLFCAEGQARARRFYEREGWRPVRRVAETKIGLPVVEYRRDLGAD